MIQIVYDNESIDGTLQSGWGLSLLIDNHILFDTGDDGEKLLENLDRLKIDIHAIRSVFISHDHWDHWGGLWDFIANNRHVEVHYPPGFSAEFKQRLAGYRVRECVRADSYELAPGMYVTDEIEFTYKGARMVERALVCSGQKTVLVSGCAHPGILQMHKRAVKCFPELHIGGALGGFHLEARPDAETAALYTEYKQVFTDLFVPLHCSGPYIRQLSGCNQGAGSLLII